MKSLFKKTEIKKARPYWHIDAKWVCALMLAVSLLVTLPVVAAFRLTSRGPAVDLIAYTFAGMTSPQGIDSEAGVEDIKSKLAQTGTSTINFGGVEVDLNAEEVNSLTPRELRLKVFRTFAEQFYDKGVSGLAADQNVGHDALAKLENDASAISIFGSSAHQRVKVILLWMVALNILLLIGVVAFSFRFGRLISPGLVFLIVGLPGVPLAIIAAQGAGVVGSARIENPENQLELIKVFTSYISPLVLPHISGVYMAVFVTGSLLILAGVIGKILSKVFTSKEGQMVTPSDERPGNEAMLKKDQDS